MSGRHQVLQIAMPDGSVVEFRAMLTKAGAKLSERDIEAIQACIQAISAKRLDPKRADRRATAAHRAKSLCVANNSHEDDGEGFCLACGEPVR